MPKLTIEKEQPAGKLRTNSLRASLAYCIRESFVMLPLLSTKKMKWKAGPSVRLAYSGSSSSITSSSSYGFGGSKVGTNEAEHATSPVASFSA